MNTCFLVLPCAEFNVLKHFKLVEMMTQRPLLGKSFIFDVATSEIDTEISIKKAY